MTEDTYNTLRYLATRAEEEDRDMTVDPALVIELLDLADAFYVLLAREEASDAK